MGSGKATLRRYEDDLNAGGYGVIILGVWDILKLIIHIQLEGIGRYYVSTQSEQTELLKTVEMITVVAVILVLCFLSFKIHLYIGINASRDARGQSYKKGYYTWAVILLVFTLLSMSEYVDEIRDLEHIDTTVASLIVDLTMIYCIAMVIWASRKVRKLRAATSDET